MSFEVRLCNADRCLTRVPPPRLFCTRHWFFVPQKLRHEIADACGGDAKALEVILRHARVAVSNEEKKSLVL